MNKSSQSFSSLRGSVASFSLYCVTDALVSTVQSNSVNPVGIHGTPGQAITVQVSGSAEIKGNNPVILDETGYGRFDIADAVAETVTVTAIGEGVQQSGIMNFVNGYSVNVFGSNNLYQLTKNAPADGKTPNIVYCANQNGYGISVTSNAYFVNGTNHYENRNEADLAAEVFDKAAETSILFESTGVSVGEIVFLPVL